MSSLLLTKIKEELNVALKASNKEKVETLRFLLSEIGNYEIDKYPPSVKGEMTDEDVISVLQKQVKRHRESIEMFEKGARMDLVEKEKIELGILQSYLPAQMGEEEVRAKIKAIKDANSGGDFGSLMKLAIGELKGKVDGGLVSKILKEE